MSLRDIYERSFDEEDGKTFTETTCPECTGELITDGGECSCAGCGLIVGENYLDNGPEWRTFNDSPNRERTGAPLTFTRHDRGLSTEISYGGDAKGNALPSEKRRQIARLRTQHNRGRWRSKGERNLAHACAEIARITAGLDLPKTVREEASAIYRTAQREDLIQGRSIESITAGSVYAACRCGGYTRSIADVASVSRCDPDSVLHGYRVLHTELGLNVQLVRPGALIPRFASACGVSDQVRHRERMLRTARTGHVVNHNIPTRSGILAL